MSTARRLVAAAAAGILGLVAVGPPASAAQPTVTWTRPTLEDNVLEEPGLITGTIAGEEDHAIESISFELIPETATSDSDDPCFVEPPAETMVFTEGNSTEDFDLELDFPCNRAYELIATVEFGDGSLTDPLLGTEPVTSSIQFSVAIPPGQVSDAAATFDEATREVRLTWAPNSEPDLLGYFVERNPPGPSGFERITPELLPPGQTSFTDPGIEDEHRYRVTAVRRGPTDLQDVQGEASSPLTAGPERTEPTLPDDIPAPNSRPAPSSGGSGGGGTRRSAPAPSQTRPTSNIFEETLPFDPSRTTLPPPTTTEPPEDAAVLAEFDDEPTGDDRRATLVPVAGGLALVVGAMHLFLLSKRAGEPDDIPMSPR